MQWKITVKPENEAMTRWTWVAECAETDTVKVGQALSQEEALAEARGMAEWVNHVRLVIEEATIVEEYTPTGVVPNETTYYAAEDL